MKKIEGFKLTNGLIVESKAEAIRLQKKIDFEKAVWKFANEKGCYNDDIDILGNIILENADELSKMLNAR